jgi:hypothetical protein
LLNSSKLERTLGHVTDIRKQNALEEAEKLKPEERTMTVSKFTKGLGLNKTVFRVFQDIDSNEQPAARTRRGIMRLLACLLACCEILKEKKSSLSRQTSVLGFYTSFSGVCASPPVVLDTGGDDPDDPPRFKRDYLLLELSLLTSHFL